MKVIRRRLVAACVAVCLLATSAIARRLPHTPIPPVISDGIRYSPEENARNHYVVATDASSGKMLWKVRVFHTFIKLWTEIDVQWIYITSLTLAGNTLLVTDERLRCYSIDLTRKRVKKQPCGGSFP
jgi:hypothetical protein